MKGGSRRDKRHLEQVGGRGDDPIALTVKRVLARDVCFFFFQAEDGIRDYKVTGVQTCALPICDLSAALDPWQIVASRTALGGAAPGEVRRMAAEADAEAARLAGEARRWRDTYRSEERRVGKEGRSRGSPDH